MRVFQYRVAVLSACLPIAVAISGCSQPPAQPATPATTAPAAAPAQTPAERGKVLVTVGGCHDCHSPKKIGPGGPEPDMSRALSGHREDYPLFSAGRPGSMIQKWVSPQVPRIE